MLFKRGSSAGIRPVNRSIHFIVLKGFIKFFFAASCLIGLASLITLYLFLKPRSDRSETFDLGAIAKLEIPSRIHDRHGVEIGQIKIEDRRPVKLEESP